MIVLMKISKREINIFTMKFSIKLATAVNINAPEQLESYAMRELVVN